MKKLINSKFYILNSNSGFTLIELLVVITIILVMTGVGIVSFTGAQRNARDSKRKSDLEQLRSALEMYRDDNDIYPSNLGTLEGDYIDTLPVDPRGYDYRYFPGSGNYTYSLCAYLEGGNGGCDGNPGCGGETCNYQVNNP